MPPIIETLSLFFLLASSSLCLQVTPKSKCADICLDSPYDDPSDPASSTTNTTDVTCADRDYFNTGVGSKYRDCIRCLMTSDSVDDITSENDVAWFLCECNHGHYESPP